MIRRIKGLALAVLALTATGAFTASAAQAAEIHVTQKNPVNITAELGVGHQQTFVIGDNIGLPTPTTCQQANIESTFSGQVGAAGQTTGNEFQGTATYTGCKSFGLNATVNVNGCKYTFTGAGQLANTYRVDVTNCTAGKKIEIIVPGIGCTVTVPEQHNLAANSHIFATNIPNGQIHHITADITVQGLTYETHNCPGFANTVLTHDGIYHGSATIKAFNDLGTQLKTHNGHQYNSLICGAQVGILST